MSKKVAKKIRQVLRKQDHQYLAKFAESLKLMPFPDRLRLAWMILTKTLGGRRV